ncbi:MAG: aspartate 1-decarboxylase [Candidatus Anammoxibacter sp.]
MFIEMCKSKIQPAVVTATELHYEGSITVDRDLMDAVDILPFEKVHVLNLNNGSRMETYTIEGERGSGTVCLNGAAARLAEPGDKVIIISYCSMEKDKAVGWQPKIVIVDEENKIKKTI